MVAGVVDHGGTGQQELKKKKRKKKKSTKQVAQQSKAVLWLMEITSFCEKDLVELTNNFKTIAKDTTTGLRAKGNGNTIDGGGDDLLSREEFVGHFSKVMKVSEDEAGVLFEAADSDDSGFVDYMEFLSLLAILHNGTPEEKLMLAFKAYDLDGNAHVSRKEFEKILLSTVTYDEPDRFEKITDLVNMAFGNLDLNCDNYIDITEVKKCFREDPGILAEYFGQNLVEIDSLI